ncbi:MAG TPA: glycosyltransferase family 4 protein [Mycobacteriales bacterium]|nr:glycosyltransferase family 4 protein [Mycobacteriales bacterium]
MTRVALVHPFSWPAVRRGGERYLHDLAWYLTTQGASVDVVVGGRRFGIDPHDGARMVRLRHPRRLDVRGLNRLDTFGGPALGWLTRHRYDVVHALTPTAALAAVATGQRTVYTALGHPTPDTIGRRKYDAAMFRATVRRAAAPLALSDSAADAIETITGVRPRVVPPGLRTDRFPLRDVARTGPPYVLFPAFAEDRRKGLDVLLAAFAAVLDHRPDARLQLGGGGDAQWAFDTLDPGSKERVRAATDLLGAGELDDVAGYYAAATATVLPSINEAFGLVLVESLASGTPVVGVASGGPTEIIDDERIGRLASPRDPASLAAAILEVIALAADPATAARCARHARRWDWAEHIGPLHLDVYRHAARSWR